MRGRNLFADRPIGNGSQRIAVGEDGAAGRTNDRVLEVRGHVGFGDCRGGIFFEFKSPLLNGAINLSKIVDAGVLLGGGAGFDEVGNRISWG